MKPNRRNSTRRTEEQHASMATQMLKLENENERLRKGLTAILSYTDQTSIRSFNTIRQMVRKILKVTKGGEDA